MRAQHERNNITKGKNDPRHLYPNQLFNILSSEGEGERKHAQQYSKDSNNLKENWTARSKGRKKKLAIYTTCKQHNVDEKRIDVLYMRKDTSNKSDAEQQG